MPGLAPKWYCDPPEIMKVIAVQFSIVWENKAANFAKVHQLIAAANPEQNSLVVLPEMFATGFSMNAGEIAEDYNGATEQFLSEIAQEFGIGLVAGAAMRSRDGKIRNKALVFSPAGKLISYYAKMKPFTVGGEQNHYTAGEKVAVFPFEGWNISPFICFDLRFPELFRKAAAQARPELFLVIASWPEKRAQHWIPMLQSRAIENQAYVVAVNRIGSDPYYSYRGDSMIIDPHGQILANAESREGTVQAKLDLTTLRKYREGLPFLDDLK